MRHLQGLGELPEGNDSSPNEVSKEKVITVLFSTSPTNEFW